MIQEYEVSRQTTSASFGGYNNYKVYVVYGPHVLYQTRRPEYYFVTHETLAGGQKIDIDWDAELSNPNNRETSAHGMRALVYRPLNRIAPAFTIVSRLNPDKPIEKFDGKLIHTQNYWIFQTKRVALNGYRDEEARIYTKVDYWKGQDIPFSELERLKTSSADDPVSYLHDETKYYVRAAKHFRMMI